ncbi:protein-tyrosine-phosphatase [bacterium]|nr:MAG: protein-tyrosine-phosphatase [bacterium]RKZ13986.1 MAG: protein-tyrosine-phosphatase [bacterium]
MRLFAGLVGLLDGSLGGTSIGPSGGSSGGGTGVAPGREESLGRLVEFVQQRRDSGEPARLVFICTHNSRRSQMAQFWAQAAAAHFGVGEVECYSGGTVATELNPHAVSALRGCGFQVQMKVPTDNPVYEVRFAEEGAPIVAFSKAYSDPPNPRDGYCAVMTCSDADEECPVVAGADLRVSLPYEDPKVADGTGREGEVYAERCRAIGVEMGWVFARVRSGA